MPTLPPPARFTKDLGAFFDRHPLAEDAIWTATSSTDPVVIRCHFYSPDSMPEILQMKYEASLPTAKVRSADLSGVLRGTTFVVRGTTYYVLASEESNSGTTRLILSTETQHG